jgi:hypothetical protein
MNRLVLLLLCQAAAQSPGNGISKSTYSCNDPLAAKSFLEKYFTVETPGDECSNDICECSATSTTSKWYIQQGRVYLPDQSVDAVSGRRLQSPGNGFGLHCVNVSNHLTTGGLSTAEVEAHFTEKLGDMTKFGSFMDYSMTLYTSDIAKFAKAFDNDKVAYYTTTWQSSSDEDAQSYTSLIVQVPNTQMILELTSKKSLSLGETQRRVHAAASHERRASPRVLAMMEKLEETGDSVIALSVNRAVSSATLAKLDDFYVTGMGTSKVSHDTHEDSAYSRQCYLWSGAKVDICFTSRDDSATKGNWKVADFENMLNTVHKNIIVGHPFCGMDKWEDNHYAVDSQSADTSKIVSYVNSKNPPHLCESSGPGALGEKFPPSGGSSMHYIFDPTGWGIQVDLGFSTEPDDCKSSADNKRRLQGSNPACSPGTCGSSNIIV